MKDLLIVVLLSIASAAPYLNVFADATTADAFDYPVGIPDHNGWIKSQDFNNFYESKKGYHTGEDWVLDGNGTKGQPVYSIANGIVIRAGNYGKCWANVIMVIHTAPEGKFFNLGNGEQANYLISFYAHLTNLSVRVNDKVLRGQKIGTVAPKTSCSTAPHLHFEIRKDIYNNKGAIPLGPGYLNNFITELDSWVNPSELIELNRILNSTLSPSSTMIFQPGSEGFDTGYGTVYAPGPNGNAETLYDGGWGDYYYNFFMWDLSSLPSAANVSNVLLYLYFNATGHDPAFQVQRTTSLWKEETLTRYNYPTAVAWGNWTGLINTGWYSLDITELYKNWKNGIWPNYGIELVPTANNNTNGNIISSDYQADPALRPKLVITTQ